jgi:hypothetical protein
MMPKIQAIGIDRAKGMIPKELLAAEAVDSKAQGRLEALIRLITFANLDIAAMISDTAPSTASKKTKTPTKEEFDLAFRFLNQRPNPIDSVEKILVSGPIQAHPARSLGAGDFREISMFKAYVKATTAAADTLTAAGDSKQAIVVLVTSLHTADALMNIHGTMTDYLVAVAVEAIVLRSIQVCASNPKFKAEDCRYLLKYLTPAPTVDDVLAQAERTDFQVEVPTLANPLNYGSVGSKHQDQEQGDGPYDPIETIDTQSKVVQIATRNARRPLSEFDPSGAEMVERAAKEVPEAGAQIPEGRLAQLKERYTMDFGENTIGRQIIGAGSTDRLAVVASCKWRAMRDATRILLASRIYQAEHGGLAPASASGFLPIIGQWPRDPFNGKDMLYNPQKRAIYSVGEDLKDDGGDIGEWKKPGKDVGVFIAPYSGA